MAGELGYSVKLIARARMRRRGGGARVQPTLCRSTTRWRAVGGAFNAVMLQGGAIREVTLAGPGAGGEETATRRDRRPAGG